MPTLHLKHPIKLSERSSIDKLTFRAHTIAADYLSFDTRGGVAQRIALIASMAGTDEEIVKRLHGHDYRKAVDIVDTLIDADDAFDAGADAVSQTKSGEGIPVSAVRGDAEKKSLESSPPQDS